jgi:hypothetical protein
MPALYEYLGILLFFYSNEHAPIHVHAKHNGCESKAELYIVDGKITEVKIVGVKGRRPLTGSTLKNFEAFLEKYADQIVAKWVDFFVYHKDIELEKITTHIK